jgi:phage I-like protein
VKIKDVERFKKGLNDTQKKEYVQIVSAETSRLLKEGRPALEAEGRAIQKANSMFGDTAKAMHYSEFESTNIIVTLAEAGTSEDKQLVLPTGTTYDAWYGELIFTENFMKEMVKNQDRLKNTEPFLNEGHDRGKACAWATELEASEDGLLVKWDFTELGTDLVQKKIYKYFSAEIGSVTDADTGERVFPVFRGCALTNSPVMKNLPEVHLQEVTLNEKPNGGKEVNFNEIMEALNGLTLSDAEKAIIAKDYSIIDTDLAEKLKAKDEVIVSLNEKVIALNAEVLSFSADKIEVKLSEAMTAGKITPATKDVWKARLEKDFEEYSGIIDSLATVADFKEHGSELDEDKIKGKKSSEYTGRNK